MLVLTCLALTVSPLAFGDGLAADPADVAVKDQALSHGHLPPAAEDVVRDGITRAFAEQQAQAADPGNDTDFADLGRTDAAQLFSAEQPDVVHGEGWADPDPADRAASVTLMSPTTASVTADDGTTSMAISSEPMGFETATGALQRIDLDLHSVADGFRADASPVTTVLPESSADPIRLGSGDTALSISPDGTAVIGVLRDSGVFYANIADDVDFFVKPVLGGVETYHVLRSVQSPEDLTVDVAGPSPADSRLVVGDDRSATVKIGDDKPWTISPVTAADANGTDVPVTVSYAGDHMTIHVAHRDKGFVYPITVDPTYNMDASGAIDGCWSEVRNYHNGCQVDAWEGSSNSTYNSMSWTGSGINGWYYWTSAPGRMANYAGNDNLGTGLYIRDLIPGNYTAWSDAAYWTLTAPPETRITKAFFANLSTDNYSDNASCSFVGIIENNNTWGVGGPAYVGNCAQTTYDTVALRCEGNNCNAGLGGTIQNWAVFGTDIRKTGPTNGFNHDMGAAIVFMHDDVGPRLGEVGVRDDANNGPFNADIEDWGLGLKRWSVRSPRNIYWGGDWDDARNNPGCSGGIGRLACPRAFTPSYSLCGLPPGTNNIYMSATDVSGNAPANPHMGIVNVHAGLTATTGSFFGTPGLTFGSNETATVHTEAQDPCGVGTMTATLDTTNLGDVNGAVGNWTIDTTSLNPGPHTLTVGAVRNGLAGEATSQPRSLDPRTYTFYVAPTSVTYGGADRAVTTTTELQLLQAGLESESLTDAASNAMWAGLTPSDQARMTDFDQNGPESFPPASGPSPAENTSEDDSAYAAVTVPEPSYLNAKSLGACGNVGQTKDWYGFPAPDLVLPQTVPSSHLWWRVESNGVDAATGKQYKRMFVELRITSAYRHLNPTAANVRLTAQTQRKVGTFQDRVSGNAQQRQVGRSNRLFNYYHGTVTAFVGQQLYIRGRTTFGTPVTGLTVRGQAFTWKGEHMPPNDEIGTKWLMCAV